MNRAKHPAIWLLALSLMLSWFLASQTARAGEFDELIDQLKHDDSRVRAKAASALGRLGDKRAIEPLIGVLKDENARMRSLAAEGLGELGEKRAVQPLVAVLKDEDEEVRRSATEALRKLGRQPGTDVE